MDREYYFAPVPDSYSRKMDSDIWRSELPYGYVVSPPSSDTYDYDQAAKESHKQYSRKNR